MVILIVLLAFISILDKLYQATSFSSNMSYINAN